MWLLSLRRVRTAKFWLFNFYHIIWTNINYNYIIAKRGEEYIWYQLKRTLLKITKLIIIKDIELWVKFLLYWNYWCFYSLILFIRCACGRAFFNPIPPIIILMIEIILYFITRNRVGTKKEQKMMVIVYIILLIIFCISLVAIQNPHNTIIS